MAAIQTAGPSAVWARGGGGGFRGAGGAGFDRGGGFDQGFGDRGFDSGFGERGFDSGFADRGFDQGFADRGFDQMPAEADLRAGADREYGQTGSFPTDGGFGSVAERSDYGNYTSRTTPAAMDARADAVRNDYADYGVFDRGWWGDHADAWYYPGWQDGWAWESTAWPSLAAWWGMSAASQPADYDFGNNITYQNDTVYYGSQPIESAAAYYNQAQNLAVSQPVPASTVSTAKSWAKDWKPLGVFSLTQAGQTDTTMMFQLAVNKKGAIKGNYYNVLTNETKPVTGAVDKKDMRVAWTIGNNKSVVYDTGLANLLQRQGSVLVHIGKNQTQQWTIVKLQQPKKASPSH